MIYGGAFSFLVQEWIIFLFSLSLSPYSIVCGARTKKKGKEYFIARNSFCVRIAMGKREKRAGGSIGSLNLCTLPSFCSILLWHLAIHDGEDLKVDDVWGKIIINVTIFVFLNLEMVLSMKIGFCHEFYLCSVSSLFTSIRLQLICLQFFAPVSSQVSPARNSGNCHSLRKLFHTFLLFFIFQTYFSSISNFLRYSRNFKTPPTTTLFQSSISFASFVFRDFLSPRTLPSSSIKSHSVLQDKHRAEIEFISNKPSKPLWVL